MVLESVLTLFYHCCLPATFGPKAIIKGTHFQITNFALLYNHSNTKGPPPLIATSLFSYNTILVYSCILPLLPYQLLIYDGLATMRRCLRSFVSSFFAILYKYVSLKVLKKCVHSNYLLIISVYLTIFRQLYKQIFAEILSKRKILAELDGKIAEQLVQYFGPI